jgi:hypothetical protein
MLIPALFTNGNSHDAPLPVNELRKCGIYTQWSFLLSHKEE